MKAFVIPQPGAQTVELADVPVPDIDDDELLVRVHAVGVGIHDSYFLPGDAAYPYPIGIESAAIPVAGNTVLKALRAPAAVPNGGSLFIAGGSGAIGTFAIQLARLRGWRIAASASAANHNYLLYLGAEKAVDYHDPNWPEQILGWMPGGVDAVMAVQPGTSAESLPVVKNGGSLISISGDFLTSERGVCMMAIPYQVDVVGELVGLIEQTAAGNIPLELECIYPFEDALAALAKVQTRRARGKLVLRRQ